MTTQNNLHLQSGAIASAIALHFTIMKPIIQEAIRAAGLAPTPATFTCVTAQILAAAALAVFEANAELGDDIAITHASAASALAGAMLAQSRQRIDDAQQERKQ